MLNKKEIKMNDDYHGDEPELEYEKELLEEEKYSYNEDNREEDYLYE